MLGFSGFDDPTYNRAGGTQLEKSELALLARLEHGNLTSEIGSLPHPFVFGRNHLLVEAGVLRTGLDYADMDATIELREFLPQRIRGGREGELRHRIWHEEWCRDAPNQ